MKKRPTPWINRPSRLNTARKKINDAKKEAKKLSGYTAQHAAQDELNMKIQIELAKRPVRKISIEQYMADKKQKDLNDKFLWEQRVKSASGQR